MILVTVGTENFPFNRFMKWVEELIQQNHIPQEEEIIVQYGSCTFIPNSTKLYTLLPKEKFEQLLSQARLIIAHCGEGTIDTLAKINVPFVLVPRSHQFGEHVDDHQMELAEALAQQGVAIAKTIEDLKQFVAHPSLSNVSVAPSDYYAYASQLIEKEFISTTTNSYSWGKNIFNHIFHTIQNILLKKPVLSN